MANSKLTQIKLTISGPLSKKELLNRIKEELDKEFPTDVVADSKITVTCDHKGHHKPPKKG